MQLKKLRRGDTVAVYVDGFHDYVLCRLLQYPKPNEDIPTRDRTFDTFLLLEDEEGNIINLICQGNESMSLCPWHSVNGNEMSLGHKHIMVFADPTMADSLLNGYTVWEDQQFSGPSIERQDIGVNKVREVNRPRSLKLEERYRDALLESVQLVLTEDKVDEVAGEVEELVNRAANIMEVMRFLNGKGIKARALNNVDYEGKIVAFGVAGNIYVVRFDNHNKATEVFKHSK